MRALLTTLAVLPALCAVTLADDLTPQRRQELEKKAQDLDQEALREYQHGAYAKAVELLTEALDINRQLYPKGKYSDGHPQLANSLSALGMVYHVSGEYGLAEPLFREALAMYRALFPRAKYPQGHPDLALSIHNLASLHLSLIHI